MHLDFTDIVRLDFDSKNPKVVWDKPNVRRPQIRFAPGGIMEMSTHCLVPTAEVCKIEIVILGSVVNAFRHQPTSRYRTMKRILAWGRRIVARVRRAKNIEEPAESIKEPVVSQWRASRVSLPSCPAGVRA